MIDFIEAQNRVYDRVICELQNGRKESHWMWFIFPQLSGLGQSFNSIRYAIKDKEEALNYINNFTLGPRLKQCTRLVLSIDDKSATDIFGTPDDLKLKSCMTLFETVSDSPLFNEVLHKYYGGERDDVTLRLLK